MRATKNKVGKRMKEEEIRNKRMKEEEKCNKRMKVGEKCSKRRNKEKRKKIT